MEYDITASTVLIAGLKGSGKTTMARHLARLVAPDRLAIYDPMREFRAREFEAAERAEPDMILSRRAFDDWMAGLMPEPPKKTTRHDVVIVDEANVYAPNKHELSEPLFAYINMGRHMRVGLVAVTRRLPQLNTHIVELADILIFYKLTGSNDITRLNRISAGLGVEVARLPQYHYAVVKDGDYTIHSPLEDPNAKRTSGGGERQRGRRRG